MHGHKIAATGEIFPDGSVGPIGGIKQKTIGAREARVDAFLVPAGDNARDARKYAHGLRIIPVESFSTGVARAGDTPSGTVGKRQFSARSKLPENARFPFRQALFGGRRRS